MRQHEFTHKGRAFIVKAIQVDNGWRVTVLENGQQVIPFSYFVSYDTEIAARLGTTGTLPIDLVDQLMTIAQSDIENSVVSV